MNNYHILFGLSFLEYIFDLFTKTNCNTIIGHIFLYWHHVLAVYIFIGWYLFSPRYHLYLMFSLHTIQTLLF